MSDKPQRTREQMISNGEVINKGEVSRSVNLKPGDTFFMQNETYIGKYTVTSTRNDSGTQFINAAGPQGDAVFEVVYLQKELAKGKMRFFNEDGSLSD